MDHPEDLYIFDFSQVFRKLNKIVTDNSKSKTMRYKILRPNGATNINRLNVEDNSFAESILLVK